jgi:hypothetical protein
LSPPSRMRARSPSVAASSSTPDSMTTP